MENGAHAATVAVNHWRVPGKPWELPERGRVSMDSVKSQAAVSRFRAAVCTLRRMPTPRPKPLPGLLAGLLALAVFAGAAVGMTSGSGANAPSAAPAPTAQVVSDTGQQLRDEGRFRPGDAAFADVRGRDGEGGGDGGRGDGGR